MLTTIFSAIIRMRVENMLIRPFVEPRIIVHKHRSPCLSDDAEALHLFCFWHDVVNFGIKRAQELHLSDLGGIAIGLDFDDSDNTKLNDDIDSVEVALALGNKVPSE